MKYGFIGCGNMGSAVARALVKVNTDFCVSDRSGKAKIFADEIGVSYTDVKNIALNCDRIFLCVKPQMMADVIKGISEILTQRRPVLISMAAGLTTDTISDMAGGDMPVIRIMPNTPVSVEKGVVLYCRNELVSDADLYDFVNDIRFAGKIDMLPEKLFDPATAVSGCGPAYAYMFIEALADGAVSCGIPRAKAVEYAANVLAGAAEMVISTGKHPGELKDAVCSPGGSTIEGVRVLEQEGFRSAVINCVVAAAEKNRELGKKA